MTYEYMLHTWGGFYNQEAKALHGEESGCQFFATAEARQQELDRLLLLETEYKQKGLPFICLAHSFAEGDEVRLHTIVRGIATYECKEYPLEYDFGSGYDVESADYCFSDGNYSCDCSLADMIQEQCDPSFLDLPCGDAVNWTFTVTKELLPNENKRQRVGTECTHPTQSPAKNAGEGETNYFTCDICKEPC